MDKLLIIDVGMHTGKDTAFYLAKGFSVIAIEANPELVKQARLQFADALSSKRLTIYDVAIADYEGEIEFYANHQHDDWGTTSKEFASRNERLGTDSTLIQVKCTRFQNILKQHGIPYYLKIDIEGADTLCLKALGDFGEKPKYVSVEAGLNSFEEAFAELSLLWSFGYREFKIVNQALNSRVRCQNPPREGRFVDFHFDGACSGPFGEEAPGNWMSIEETFLKYRRLLAEQRYFGAGGKLYRTLVHRMYEVLRWQPVGWYDFHAKLASS